MQTEPRLIATPFLQMHAAGMPLHRGNMVEARVPRALSSIRYDTLTFLRCRMRKTMAAASWINDTIHGSIQEDEAGHRLTFSASRACLVTRLYCNHTFVRGEIKPLLFMGPPLLSPPPSTNNRRDSYRDVSREFTY